MVWFLVQVSKDIGFANITSNQRYQNNLWTEKARDKDHGAVEPGDELLVYCTSNVPSHGASLAFSVAVKGVSSDKVTFQLAEPHWFKSPIKRQDIIALVYGHSLPEVFGKCGQQGFNIARVEQSAAQQILALGNAVHDDKAGQDCLQALAKKTLLPVGFHEEIELLLEDKRQVIFQGPPGTGKTYVAQKLARHLAGSEERVTLVQFHPSYAYEDFVQGYRPALVAGQPGFEMRDGPLLQAAERARADLSGAKHFLVIDEINRGNLAKVFGELYFLLEYRDEKMRLQYQNDDEELFSLPKNLYIIGTMNTADRSIALVDLALRRRFYFVMFHPDEEPVKGVLRRWLMEKEPSMEWVSDVVEEANKKLRVDRHAAIGPSYFMKDILDEDVVKRIWKHSVLPYIEERRFGGDEVTEEFDLERLRREVGRGGSASGDAQEGSGGATENQGGAGIEDGGPE